MAKKNVVTFTLTDGVSPTNVGGFVKLRAPFALHITPGNTQVLNLGLSFDTPLALLKAGISQLGAVELVNASSVFLPGADVVLVFKSSSDTLVEAGDTVAYAMFSPDIELVKKV